MALQSERESALLASLGLLVRAIE